MANDNEFFKVLSSISDEETMAKFLREMLTEKEFRDLSLRWRLLKLIEQKMPQREIASKLGISLCKITRGSRLLKDSESVTFKILKNNKL